MPQAEQGAETTRYSLVPRTIIFLRNGGAFLLMRGARGKWLWSEKYNGVGGHIERGEDALTSARRELREETGLEANLWLCGTVIVDAGPAGVGLFVFTGEVTGGSMQPSPEGNAEWVQAGHVRDLACVEDVPQLLERISTMRRGDPPFSARSHYDSTGNLHLEFSA